MCLEAIPQTDNINWPDIFKKCGFSDVIANLASAKHISSPPPLSSRVRVLVSQILRSKAKEYDTTMEQDRELLAAHSLELKNMLSAGFPLTPSSPSAAALRKLNAVQYRLYHKELLQGICSLYGTNQCFLGDHSSSTQQNLAAAAAPQGNIPSDEPHASPLTLQDIWRSPLSPTTLGTYIVEFNDWFSASLPPPFIHHVKAQYIPGYRIGTVATKNLELNEVYLGIPQPVIMNSAMELSTPAMSSLLTKIEKAYQGRDDFHTLLLILLNEAFSLGSRSTFWPYLRLLPSPRDMDIPLMWTDEEISARLGPSHLKDSLLLYTARVRRTYSAFSRVPLLVEMVSEGILTNETYRWAQAILDSRSIWWNGERHLVPMLDFVNCMETANADEQEVLRIHSTQWERGQAVTKSGIFYPVTNAAHILRDIAWPFATGEQVFENYGQPNHIYFSYHGFILENNHYDCVELSLSLSSQEEKALSLDWSIVKPLIQVWLSDESFLFSRYLFRGWVLG
jgi:hypothetical protein